MPPGIPPGLPPGVPQYGAPVPPPQKTNQAALWIVVILGACLMCTIVVGLLFVRLIVHRVKIGAARGNVSIETPAGSVRVSRGDSHPAGLPVYPGAKSMSDNRHSIELSANDAYVALATEVYRTPDSIEQVRDWYRQRLGAEFKLETHSDKRSSSNGDPDFDTDDHEMAFVDDRDDGARIIALDSSSGGTKITMLRVGKRDTQ